MANGDNAAVDAVETAAQRTSGSQRQRKPHPRKGSPERAASRPECGADQPDRHAADDQESLATAAETLANRLGMAPPPGVDEALGAGQRASMATVRAHRLVVEFHLGQLDRTLRAGRALTNCRSFEDAVEVHRLFMQETLRASATHLRDLAEIGLGASSGADKRPNA